MLIKVLVKFCFILIRVFSYSYLITFINKYHRFVKFYKFKIKFEKLRKSTDVCFTRL